MRKVSYWAGLNAEDCSVILRLPSRAREIERHGYIVRESEQVTKSWMVKGEDHKIMKLLSVRNRALC